MSAGKFDRDGRYQSDVGNVYRCRPQPETSKARLNNRTNLYALGSVTPGLGSLKLVSPVTALGLSPRAVIVRLTGSIPASRGDYEGVGTLLRIVVFRLAVYDLYQVGGTGNYLGISCVIDRKQPEVLR